MFMNKGTDIGNVMYIYNEIQFSHKNEILLFETTSVELEGIMLSEIIQTERDTDYIILLIHGT